MKLNSIQSSELSPNPITIFRSYNDKSENQVKIKGISDSEPWELYDALGTKVLKGSGQQLNLNTLPTGMYLLEVSGQLFKVLK